MRAMARIPVEFYYDEDAHNWHFEARTGEIDIVGGGQANIEEARQAAAEAIAYALRGQEHTTAQHGRVEYLDVAVG